MFLDSAVAGIRYETSPGAKSGITNARGEFEYVEGDSVVFRIGELALPPTTAQGVVTPADLARVSGTVDETTQSNILRLLQTLDSDGDPDNGIDIADTAHSLFSTATGIDFAAPEAEFASLTEPLLETSLVSSEQALAHFKHTLELQLQGSWLYSEGDGKRNVLTFIDKQQYIIIHEYDDGESQPAGSVEYGNYEWNAFSGAVSFTGIEESDGEGGLWNQTKGSSVTAMALDGNSLTLSIDGEVSPVFTKIQDRDNALIGAWLLKEHDPDGLNVLTFLSPSEYVIAHTNNAEDYPDQANQKLSGEFGTYTLSATGQFLVTGASVDTDGEGGLYNKTNPNDQARETIAVMPWGDLRFTDDDEGAFSFARVGYMVAALQDLSAENPLGTALVVRDLNSNLAESLAGGINFSFTVPLADDTTSRFDLSFNPAGPNTLTVTTGAEEPEQLTFTWSIADTGFIAIEIADGDEALRINIAPTLTQDSATKALVSIQGLADGEVTEDSLWLTSLIFEG